MPVAVNERTECIWVADGIEVQSDGRLSSALASNRYRVLLPISGLDRAGEPSRIMSFDEWLRVSLDTFAGCRVIVIGKLLPAVKQVIPGARYDAVIDRVRELQTLGIKVLADFCDDHFDRPADGYYWRGLAKSVDVCVAGSDAMATRIASVGSRPVCVVGDPVAAPHRPARVFRHAGTTGSRILNWVARGGAQGRRLQLVWYGHPSNWLALKPWVEALMKADGLPPIMIWVVSAPVPALVDFVGQASSNQDSSVRMEFVPWSEDEQWSVVGNSDVVLLPAGLDDSRKAVKTANRLIDGIMSGCYVIASPVPAYHAYADHVSLTADPVAALRDYLAQPDKALQGIERGQAAVEARAGMGVVVQQWLAALKLADDALVQEHASTDTKHDVRAEVLKIRSSKVDMEDLISAWRDSPHPSTKFTSYFAAYAELLAHLRGQPCTFIETGVLGGGSLFMWRRWLGPQARIIGVDLNPAAKRWEGYGFEVFIGDQGDPDFWRSTLARIGQFDALLDDGGHQSFQQIVTVQECLRHLKQRAVVVVEDTHTSFMAEFNRHGVHSFLQYAKDSTDVLTARTAGAYPTRFREVVNQESQSCFADVLSIQFFGSMVAFKIDPSLSIKPELIWNRPAGDVKDFRYKGKNFADVTWPNPFGVEQVTVRGGEG